MEVILLQKIHNLGALGDKVRVKPGYARNLLLPQRMAVAATRENIAKFEVQRAELESAQTVGLEAARARAAQLEGLAVTVRAKAGTEGKLYGSVGAADIAAAVTAAGHALEKREVRLPAGPLREIGEHVVNVHLHTDVDLDIRVMIVSDSEPAVAAAPPAEAPAAVDEAPGAPED